MKVALENVAENFSKKIAARLPIWLTPCVSASIGVVSAVLCVSFCGIANININWIFGSFICLLLNLLWNGLTLISIRNVYSEDSKYGFLLYHSTDILTICLLCISLGVSPIMNLNVSLFMMCGYLILTLRDNIHNAVIGNFRLTCRDADSNLFRIILIAMFALYIFNPFEERRIEISGGSWSVYDFMGGIVAIVLFLIWGISIINSVWDHRDTIK